MYRDVPQRGTGNQLSIQKMAEHAKSDRNYAVGIARSMQTGWYREGRVKRLDSHAIKALLVGRALLVKMRGEIENQIRGLVKNLGLVIGRAKRNTFTTRVQKRSGAQPALQAVAEPLLQAAAH